MRVFVLLFNARTDSEGIHTIQIGERNTVLMFESEDDAIRYAGLLEAQDFPTPSVELFDEVEIVEFCKSTDYEWKLVPAGELAIPPELNVEQTGLEMEVRKEETELPQSELDRIRSRLERLL